MSSYGRGRSITFLNSLYVLSPPFSGFTWRVCRLPSALGTTGDLYSMVLFCRMLSTTVHFDMWESCGESGTSDKLHHRPFCQGGCLLTQFGIGLRRSFCPYGSRYSLLSRSLGGDRNPLIWDDSSPPRVLLIVLDGYKIDSPRRIITPSQNSLVHLVGALPLPHDSPDDSQRT